MERDYALSSGTAATPADVLAGAGASDARAAAPAAGAAMPAAPATPSAAPQVIPPARAAAPATNVRPRIGDARPADDHHSMVNGIVEALSGGKQYRYERDPETGKMIATEISGNKWQRMIAGALTGAARGAAARPGPGQLGRAAAAGFEGGAEMVQHQDQQARQQADTDYDAGQKAMVRKAQTALLTQQTSESVFRLGRLKIQEAFKDSDRETAFMRSIQAGGSGSRDLGVARSVDDVMAMHKNIPNLLEEQAHGNIIATPHFENGELAGMRYALVTPAWKQAKLDHDETISILRPPKDAANNGMPTIETQTVKAGTMSNGEFQNARMASDKEVLKWYETKYKEDASTARNNADNTASLEGHRIDAASREAVADKKATGSFTNNTKGMIEAAPTVISFVKKANDLITANEDELGPVMGRWNEVMTGKVGVDNPGIQQLRTNLKLLTTRLMQMHTGNRPAVAIFKEFKNMLETAQSPDNLRAILGEINKYAEEIKAKGNGGQVNLPQVGDDGAAAGKIHFQPSDGQPAMEVDADKWEEVLKLDPNAKIIDHQ